VRGCLNLIKTFFVNKDLLFDILEIFSPAIPLVTIAIKGFKKSTWLILLIFYLVIYLILSAYAASLRPKNNIVVYIIISLFTFCFFALILEQFIRQKKFKIINRTVMIIAVLFLIINAIWGEGLLIFNSYSSGLTNFILVSYCVYYYKLQLENSRIFFVEKQPSFWIVSGIFIYCAGNFFLFSMFNSLSRNNLVFAFYAWNINDFLILVMNIAFAKGIQCNLKT